MPVFSGEESRRAQRPAPGRPPRPRRDEAVGGGRGAAGDEPLVDLIADRKKSAPGTLELRRGLRRARVAHGRGLAHGRRPRRGEGAAPGAGPRARPSRRSALTHWTWSGLPNWRRSDSPSCDTRRSTTGRTPRLSVLRTPLPQRPERAAVSRAAVESGRGRGGRIGL